MRMWGGKGYEDSYYVALWLIIPVTVPLIQNLGIEIQRAKNKHQARAVVYFFIAIGDQNATYVIFSVSSMDIICMAEEYTPVSAKSFRKRIDHLSIDDRSHSISSIGTNGIPYRRSCSVFIS